MASGKAAKKDKHTFLSLPERLVELATGRFPGLGFRLLAAPSRPSICLRTVAWLRLS